METVITVLLAGSVLVAVLWVGSERRHATGPAAARPSRPDLPPPHLGVAAAAVAHPDGIPGIGRHDERRCPH
jgi:hypothetical protein